MLPAFVQRWKVGGEEASIGCCSSIEQEYELPVCLFAFLSEISTESAIIGYPDPFWGLSGRGHQILKGGESRI